MVSGDFLFQRGRLRDFLNERIEDIKKAVRNVSRDEILYADLDALAAQIYEKHVLKAPEIDGEGISRSNLEDAQVDVSGDQMRAVYDRSTPTYVDGTAVTFYVPFTGDHRLFHYRPSTFTLNPPRATQVDQKQLAFEYKWVRDGAGPQDADEQFRRDLGRVKNTLENVQEDVESAFASLQSRIQSQLRTRKENVQEDREDADALPYPVKRRDDAPDTYKVPVKRKSIDPAPEENGEGDEPKGRYLGDDDYEDILHVLRNMTDVMERSPSAFRNMDEEDLRTHFLVQLNGQFEGPATGETFNRKGKTDIFLPAEGRAVFIAECKFWRGAEAFRDALDQLLGYASWRDTKTALLIFNQNKDTTRVLGQIPDIVEGHSNHIRTVEYDGESEFRFVLHHNDDDQRHLTMTVMVFDVPT
jgi:chaperonin cofactor prefoldin